jgi:hypothetical protein
VGTSSPDADLEIDMNYLGRDADVKALLFAIEMCRDIGASAAFKEWRKEVMPGKRDKAGMLEFCDEHNQLLLSHQHMQMGSTTWPL